MESHEIFKSNHTTKRFSQAPIDEAKIKTLTSAIRSCHSMDNRQPWKVIFVRDEETKRNLSAVCSSNKLLLEAPLVAVICGIPDDAYPTLGGYLNSFSVDAGILIGRIALVASQLGMQTEWIFSFREERIREIVKAPDECRIVSLSPLGTPSELSSLPPAKPLQELVNYDQF